jgi:hypothetical protein
MFCLVISEAEGTEPGFPLLVETMFPEPTEMLAVSCFIWQAVSAPHKCYIKKTMEMIYDG